jgi:hypothetical protein
LKNKEIQRQKHVPTNVIPFSVTKLHVTPLGNEFLLNDALGQGVSPMSFLLKACQVASPTLKIGF